MREESDRDSEKRTDLRLKDGEGGALPPSAARRRRKKDNLKQASLFPSEEEQRAEINSANTSSHRNQAEQVELYIRHILLSDETLLSQKYLVYRILRARRNTAAAVNWLRNIQPKHNIIVDDITRG